MCVCVCVCVFIYIKFLQFNPNSQTKPESISPISRTLTSINDPFLQSSTDLSHREASKYLGFIFATHAIKPNNFITLQPWTLNLATP